MPPPCHILCWCNNHLASKPSFLTLVFKSAFWIVYPEMSQLPSSFGGSHSSAALNPQTSVTLTLIGGPGLSVWIKHWCHISAQSGWISDFTPLDKKKPTRIILTVRTDNPDVDVGSVLQVLNLENQLVCSWVLSLCWADEEDCVHVWVTDVDHLGVQGLAVFVPGGDRAWLTLWECMREQLMRLKLWWDTYSFIMASGTRISQQFFVVCLSPGTGWSGWSSLPLSWCTLFWGHEGGGSLDVLKRTQMCH